MTARWLSPLGAAIRAGWWHVTGRELWFRFIETKVGVVKMIRPKAADERDEWVEEMEDAMDRTAR